MKPGLRLTVPIGTRPEIVKLAPVVNALREHGHHVRVIATGQHFDAELTDVFFSALRLQPDVRWVLPSSEADRVGAILSDAMTEIAEQRPDAVLVLGDTWTVPLFALAARRYGIAVVHLEAGLRSFNELSIEEVNRRIAGAVAQFHLAPTGLAAKFLRAEGVEEDRIEVVGNPVIDAMRLMGLAPIPVASRRGIVLTAHRASNVDDPDRLAALVDIVEALVVRHGPVCFPLHPRTRTRLNEYGLWDRFVGSGVGYCEPLGYREMLRAVASSRVVVTDSGGLQEETAWLGVPVVVLRDTTARWEGVRNGTAALTGLDRAATLQAVERFASEAEQRRIADTPCPYGVGDTAQQVVDFFDTERARNGLQLREPSAPETALSQPVATEPAPAAVANEGSDEHTSSPISAVLFDLDDTLYIQASWLDGAWDAVADRAAELANLEYEPFRRALALAASAGSARGAIIDRALAAVSGPPQVLEELVAVFRHHRQPLHMSATNGAVLRDLAARVPIGLVTDGDPRIQRAKLAGLGLAGTFDATVFSDEQGRGRRKPHPSPFLLALSRLGVPPRDAVFVGDRPETDIAGALRLGMRAIRVRTGEYAALPDVAGTWHSVEDLAAAHRCLLDSGLMNHREIAGG